MNLQDVKNITIPEGEVKTIQDSNGVLLWGGVGYNTTYRGDTTQQTYSGKNLYKTIPATGTPNGLSGTLNEDGTLTVTGTASNNGGSDITVAFNTSLPAGTYTFSINKALSFRVLLRDDDAGSNIGVINAGNKTATFTTTTTVTTLRVFFWEIVGGTTYNETIAFQLESGSSDTPFEKFVGGIPSPNPDYPQPVNVVTGRQVVTLSGGDDSHEYEVNLGKNLLDLDSLTDGYVNSVGGFDATHTKDEMYSGFIKVKPNTTYTFSIQATTSTYPAWFGVGEYTTNATSGFIKRDTNTSTSATSITFTTSATTGYVVVSARNMAGATKAQVELGSTQTTYAAYFVPMELCKIGTYQDYIYKSGDDWYVHKEIGKVILDGSESYNKVSDGKFRANISIFKNYDYGSRKQCFSDKFRCYAHYENYSYGQCYCWTNGIYIGIDSSITTTDGAKTWCSNNTPTFYGVLATATETQITDATLIAQLEAVHEWLTRYGYQYNVSGNLPLIISRV